MARAAFALLLACVVDPAAAVLTASGFVPYYTYSGGLAVGGTVGPMETTGTTQTFYYSLTGVDPACSSGKGTAPGSCGFHIHTESTCTADAGGHYFISPVTDDPWSNDYTAQADGTAYGSVTVETGGTESDINGHAFVVHAYDGTRIACGILGTGGGNAAFMAEGFVPYFSYTGALAVSGTVGPIITSGTTQTFSYSLAGLDTECSAGKGTAPGSCGFHIHTGSTCTADAGGHYFISPVTDDPWSNDYTAQADGTATGSVTVETGGTSSDINGHSFVVHAFDGTRIACAILGVAAASPPTSGGSGSGGSGSGGACPPPPPACMACPAPEDITTAGAGGIGAISGFCYGFVFGMVALAVAIDLKLAPYLVTHYQKKMALAEAKKNGGKPTGSFIEASTASATRPSFSPAAPAGPPPEGSLEASDIESALADHKARKSEAPTAPPKGPKAPPKKKSVEEAAAPPAEPEAAPKKKPAGPKAPPKKKSVEEAAAPPAEPEAEPEAAPKKKPPPKKKPAEPKQEPLPEGWEEHLDEGTGKMYYANDETGEVVWVRPK